MLTAYERHLLAIYLANAAAASGLRHRDPQTVALAAWTAVGETVPRPGQAGGAAAFHFCSAVDNTLETSGHYLYA